MDQEQVGSKEPISSAVSTPVFMAILIVAIVTVCFLGWRYLNAPRLGVNGVDLSRAGVQPAAMLRGGGGARPRAKPRRPAPANKVKPPRPTP